MATANSDTGSPPLDHELQRQLDRWLAKVAPKLAEECEPKARSYAANALIKYRAQGLQPEEAGWALSNSDWITSVIQPRYLLKGDSAALRRIAKTREKLPRQRWWRYTLIAVGVAMCTMLGLYALMIPELRVDMPWLLMPFVIFTLIPAIPILREAVIKLVGPKGPALVSAQLLLLLFVGTRFFAPITVGATDPGFSDPRAAYVILFLVVLLDRISFARRIHSNREIVARLLGLTGYEQNSNPARDD